MRRVLIAEDEPSIVTSLEFLFGQAGYEVFTALNGAEALALAEARRPDLIVLDIMLPVLDGFAVCKAVRSNPALAATRILILSARGREQETARAIALGANVYMTKPFATRELLQTARNLLGDDVPS